MKGKRTWIEEDLTWEGSRMRWRFRGIARGEMKKGRRVWVAQDRIRIEEK